MLNLAVTIITVFANAALGLVVLNKNSRNISNILFAFFVSAVCLWAIANYFSLRGQTVEQELFWIRTVLAVTAIMFSSLYIFISNFPSKYLTISTIKLAAIVSFTGIVVGLTFTPLIFKDINVSPGDLTPIGNVTPVPGPAILLFALNVVGLPLFSFWTLFKKTHSAAGQIRQQLRWIFLGITLTFALAIITNFIFVNVLRQTQFVAFGPFFTLILVAFTAYAIVAHHLFDIYIVIRRSLVFSLTFSLTLFFLVYATATLRNFFPESVSFLIISVALTLVFQPLRNFLEYVTNTFLFQKHYVFDQTVEDLTHLLGATINLDELLERFLKRLSEALQVEKAVIVLLIEKDHFISRQTIGLGKKEIIITQDNPIINYIKNTQTEFIERQSLLSFNKNENAHEEKMVVDAVNEMNKLNFEMVIPIKTKDKLIGLCLLSAKKSNESYSENDIKLLDVIFHQAGAYIENARLYEEERSFAEKLKIADSAKGEFINVVSHQFRTPLSAIRWNVDLLEEALKKEGKTEEFTDYLEPIRESTVFLTNTLSNVFDILVIEGGKLSLEYQPVQLWEIIDQAIIDMSSFAKSHNVDIIFNKTGIPLKEIQADPQKLKRIMYVLLQNAIEYNKPGGRVSISIKEGVEGRKNGIYVIIQDTGIGMEQEDIVRSYEKFFRGENAKNISPNGTGLGLFIVKSIVEAHKGSLNIESKLNEGTIVSVFLPISADGGK